MKPLNLALILAAGGLALGTVAQADPITYVFEAAPAFTTEFNGSTVTIDNNNLTSWNLLDSSISADLTTANSSVNGDLTGILSYNNDGFTGGFVVNSTATAQVLGNTVPAISFLGGDSFFGGFLSDIVVPQTQVDPPGDWTVTGGSNNSVPDGANTFLLLGTALAGLGACAHPFGRSRSAATVRI